MLVVHLEVSFYAYIPTENNSNLLLKPCSVNSMPTGCQPVWENKLLKRLEMEAWWYTICRESDSNLLSLIRVNKQNKCQEAKVDSLNLLLEPCTGVTSVNGIIER